MLRVTHMSELPDNAESGTERKKIDWQKSPRNSTLPLLIHPSRSMFTIVTLKWLTHCLPVVMSNKNPTAMCRPTLNFFFLPHAINSFIFHFLFIWRFLVSLLCVCFFPSTCLTKTRLSLQKIFLVWLMGDSNVSLFQVDPFSHRDKTTSGLYECLMDF